MTNPTPYNNSNIYPLFSGEETLNVSPIAKAAARIAIQASEDTVGNSAVEEGHGYVIDGQVHPTAAAAAKAALLAVNAIHDSMPQPDAPEGMAQLPQPELGANDVASAAQDFLGGGQRAA